MLTRCSKGKVGDMEGGEGQGRSPNHVRYMSQGYAVKTRGDSLVFYETNEAHFAVWEPTRESGRLDAGVGSTNKPILSQRREVKVDTAAITRPAGRKWNCEVPTPLALSWRRGQ